MSEAFETFEVYTEVVSCDGGGGPLGHPAVYLNLRPKGEIVCPYCSRIFTMIPKKEARL